MTIYSVDAPSRSEGTVDRLFRDLAGFVGTMRETPAPRRRQPWRRMVELHWCAFLVRSGSIEVLDDLDLYAWSRRAAVEVIAAHLPHKVQQWERATRGPAFEMRDLDPPVEPALRARESRPRLSDAEQAPFDEAKDQALSWAEERPMLPDFPVLFEAAVMAEFVKFLHEGQAPMQIPAHLVLERGLAVIDEALARRAAWRAGRPATPTQEPS